MPHLPSYLHPPVFWYIACSRRSDSGERCEVTSLPSPPLLFIAFFTPQRSPLSERLEQAIWYTNVASHSP